MEANVPPGADRAPALPIRILEACSAACNRIVRLLLVSLSAVMVVMMELDTSAELPDMIPASSFTAASGMFIAKRTNNVLAPIAYLSSIVFNSTSISTIWLI